MATKVKKKVTTSEPQIVYRFKEIRLLSFKVTEDETVKSKKIADDNFQFNFEFITKVNENKKTVIGYLTSVLVEKEVEDAKPKVNLAELQVLCAIEIKNYDDVIKKVDGNIKLSTNLVALLSGYTVSSSRGIFAACTAVYPFVSNAIMPAVPYNAFVINDNTQPEASKKEL